MSSAAPLFRRFTAACLSAAFVALTACSDGGDDNDGPGLAGCADDNSCASNPPVTIGGERPAMVRIPSNYDPGTRYPLVVVLHGFGANGLVQSNYLGLVGRVDADQVVLVMPDGTLNDQGQRFWNATQACCAFDPEDAMIDDVAYISGLIEEAAATYSIDPRRVGLIGHSNGGFMSLRMACEASELVTSLVSLAGSTFDDFDACQPATRRVSVLLLHGDQDGTILYDGLDGFYPGAMETAERFAVLGGCDAANPVAAPPRDLIGSLPGNETSVHSYPDCLGDTEVELWTLVGGPHIPGPWTGDAPVSMIRWILDHPRR